MLFRSMMRNGRWSRATGKVPGLCDTWVLGKVAGGVPWSAGGPGWGEGVGLGRPGSEGGSGERGAEGSEVGAVGGSADRVAALVNGAGSSMPRGVAGSEGMERGGRGNEGPSIGSAPENPGSSANAGGC